MAVQAWARVGPLVPPVEDPPEPPDPPRPGFPPANPDSPPVAPDVPPAPVADGLLQAATASRVMMKAPCSPAAARRNKPLAVGVVMPGDKGSTMTNPYPQVELASHGARKTDASCQGRRPVCACPDFDKLPNNSRPLARGNVDHVGPGQGIQREKPRNAGRLSCFVTTVVLPCYDVRTSSEISDDARYGNGCDPQSASGRGGSYYGKLATRLRLTRSPALAEVAAACRTCDWGISDRRSRLGTTDAHRRACL